MRKPKEPKTHSVESSTLRPAALLFCPVALIVESSDDAIIGKSMDGTILSWNAGAERVYGYEAAEVLGKSISILTGPEQPNEIPHILERIGQGERVAHFETQRVRRDGQQIDVSLTISPIKNEAGTIIGASTIARDITSQKQAERELALRSRQQAIVAELGQLALEGMARPTLLEKAMELTARCDEEAGCAVLGWPLQPGKAEVMAAGGWTKEHWQAALATMEPVAGGVVGFTEGGEFWEGRLALPVAGKPLTWMTQCLGTLLRDQSPPQGVALVRPQSAGLTTNDRYFLQAVANILSTALTRNRLEANRTRLLERVLTAQEQERRWLARELHDETGQSLTTLLVGLRLISDAATLKTARQQVDRLRALTSQTLVNIGRLARGLHPSLLDDLGLVVAVQRYLEEYGKTHQVPVTVSTQGMEQVTLSPLLEITLFRIFQEALTNVARHAEARQVQVALVAADRQVSLEVADNGKGFAVEPTLRQLSGASRLGLYGMQERAGLLGGTLLIEAAPGAGTRIRVTLPFEPVVPFHP